VIEKIEFHEGARVRKRLFSRIRKKPVVNAVCQHTDFRLGRAKAPREGLRVVAVEVSTCLRALENHNRSPVSVDGIVDLLVPVRIDVDRELRFNLQDIKYVVSKRF